MKSAFIISTTDEKEITGFATTVITTQKKKKKVQTSLREAMVGGFRDSAEHLLVESFETAAKFNSERHVRAFKKLQRRMRMFRPNR
jgi:hypothetical protein